MNNEAKHKRGLDLAINIALFIISAAFLLLALILDGA